MTTYVLIPNGDIDQDSPGTQPLFTAIRDNPIAMLEGSPNAPYNHYAWHPYNGVFIGDGVTGEVWSFSVNGAVASFESPNFLDGYEYRFDFEAVSGSSASNVVTIDLFRETTNAYSGAQSISNLLTAVADVFGGFCEVYRPKIISRVHTTYSVMLESRAGTPNINAPLVSNKSESHPTAQKISKVRFALSATFDAGAVFMKKRRVF